MSRLVFWSAIYTVLGLLLLYRLLWLCGNVEEIMLALSKVFCALFLIMGLAFIASLGVIGHRNNLLILLFLYFLLQGGFALFTDNGTEVVQIETSFLLAFFHTAIVLVNLKYVR
jgi:hypothetical protein